ncbi:stage V sporulation protein AA [Konateibacter massiliensis]|uniref:stage V sporulation protein AA n=1 Tax=Konateibacter massiliensis TaxID=2002841 RepID=UPI000C1505EA|nr:stage V sporulation protein AA [Konateibacter massiliensis]
MSDILYLKAERCVQVSTSEVRIKDIAKLECTNEVIASKVKEMVVARLDAKKEYKYVVSILKVIEVIHKEFPELEIDNIGEYDFIMEYVSEKQNLLFEYLKVVFVCCIVFIGAAFTIMTFNNDVSIDELFDQFYYLVMKKEASGFTLLELSYSIGLGAGILVFYNHFGGKRLTTDPTPIQVEMRIYEEDVNTALVKNYTREDKRIDVD